MNPVFTRPICQDTGKPIVTRKGAKLLSQRPGITISKCGSHWHARIDFAACDV